MTDLTKITTPFGLLDAETQRALQNHPGIIEWYCGPRWVSEANPFWISSATYRARPEPPKPREVYVWFNENGSIPMVVDEEPFADAILFREVLP